MDFTPKVKRSSNETTNAKIRRGESLLNARRFQDALTLFVEIIETHPDSTRPYLSAGQAALGLRFYDDALKYAKQATQCNPLNSAAALLTAKIYLEQENWSEALTYFQESVQLDSKSAASYVGMGEVAYHHQDYDKAIIMFRKALDLDQNYSRAYQLLAKAYISKEDQINEVITPDYDLLDFLERSSQLTVLEEEKLWALVGSSSSAELEEQIANLQYIAVCLQPLLDEVQWQIDFLKKACVLPGKMIVPEGLIENFETLSP
jgi:tetratricopeptide (TPR) repeat protein